MYNYIDNRDKSIPCRAFVQRMKRKYNFNPFYVWKVLNGLFGKVKGEGYTMTEIMCKFCEEYLLMKAAENKKAFARVANDLQALAEEVNK